jgi:hypothetical protein
MSKEFISQFVEEVYTYLPQRIVHDESFEVCVLETLAAVNILNGYVHEAQISTCMNPLEVGVTYLHRRMIERIDSYPESYKDDIHRRAAEKDSVNHVNRTLFLLCCGDLDYFELRSKYYPESLMSTLGEVNAHSCEVIVANRSGQSRVKIYIENVKKKTSAVDRQVIHTMDMIFNTMCDFVNPIKGGVALV